MSIQTQFVAKYLRSLGVIAVVFLLNASACSHVVFHISADESPLRPTLEFSSGGSDGQSVRVNSLAVIVARGSTRAGSYMWFVKQKDPSQSPVISKVKYGEVPPFYLEMSPAKDLEVGAEYVIELIYGDRKNVFFFEVLQEEGAIIVRQKKSHL